MAEQFRIATFGEPRTDWRDSEQAAMRDAVRLNLASWDHSKRQWFLAVPAEMQRRGTKDHAVPAARSHHRGPWSAEDLAYLRTLADRGEDPGIIALRLGRTREAVQTKARAEGIAISNLRQAK